MELSLRNPGPSEGLWDVTDERKCDTSNHGLLFTRYLILSLNHSPPLGRGNDISDRMKGRVVRQ